ncbi:MAG: PAS domain S-box protein, partial [Candidatus Omnitrophota bacterium]
VKEGNSYKISKHLREMCIFSKQNVFGDPPFSNIDLVSCRNMLIYFQPALQKKVFHNFHYSLRPGSFLVLGNSESASGYSNLFKSFDRKNKIFVKKYVSIKSMFKLSQNYYPLKKSEGGTKSGINIRKEVDVSGLADQILLKECAPCGVLIDSSMEVVQFRGHTGRFLESGAGRPNLDIFKLAREGLLMPLRSVIYQVKKTKHTVKKEVDNVSCDGRKISVSIVVIPIKPANLKDEFYLVLFNEIDRTAESKNLPRTTGKIPLKIISDKKESYVRDLEKELTETKEYLQTVIEEQENANEEIKTANEEILSSNEELQSTNEELETAKEELQSSNEELMTTNEELQNRNLEVSLLNNDLINLFGSINIPIVMMGTDLMIRRVTPQADKVLNITFSDLGRPIGRVKLNVDIPDFEKTLYGVIESLHPKIFEAQDKQGCWYSVYIRPYRTIDNKIDGVVAVFVDITASRKAAQAIEEARIYADSIIETVQESLLVVDDELKVVSANKAFYQTFKTNPKETNGCFFYGLGNGHWDIPKLRQILKNGFAKKNSVTGYEIEHNFDVIGHKIMLFSACRLASMHLTLITINDITERKVIERELVRVKETQFKTLMENLPGKVFLKDSKSVYISCNESYAKDLGVAPEAVVGKTDYEFFPTYLAEKYRADDKRVIESAKIENLEEEYVVIGDYFKEVKKSIINIVKIPVRDKAGNVMGLFGFFWDITERKKAEEELRNLNKRIEFILGATKTGLDVIDSDFNMVYINPEWQKIYGDPTGRKCYEYFMGKDKVCSNCGIVKALETKNTVVTEEVLVKENNRPVQITTIPFQDKDGNWLVAEVNVDISERKKAEEQLRISDKKIRALFDQTFQFIGMMTTDGKLIEANKTAMQFSGINEADCIGKFFWDTPWWVHSEEMQNKLREAVTKAASGEPVCFEATHLAADKSLRYIDFSLKPVKDLDGKVIFLIPEGRDITEHKKAEEELKKYHDHLEEIVKEKTKAIEESEKRFKVLFEDARDGILLVDIEAKKVIMCNKMMCSMLKYTEEELKQLTINDIHLEKDLSQVMDIFKKMAQGKAMFAENVPMRTKDGSIFYADVTASQINFSGNNYLMGNFRDTTERKKIEAALTDTIKIKSNFTGMVSHELRTPLAAIKEGVAVVLDKVTGVVNEEQVKYLNIVKNNVDRLDRLITAVLDFQKLESGKIDFNIEESCMNELVTGVYNTMLVLFKKKGLSFELKLCDNLPKAQFDKDKIVQVLTNLVNNAFKFTEIGGIIISTSVKGNFIQVEVKDSGIGIKKENIEKLFQEFTQLQRKVGGTGLGLSICKKIILAHKGEIWAESEFGKGTVFYFTIPIEIKRLGEILVEEGKISNEDLEKALEKQKKNYIISSITRKH